MVKLLSGSTERIKCFMVYSSFIDVKPSIMKVDFTDGIITERKKNPRRFELTDMSHIMKAKGMGITWVAFLDVEGRKTIDIKTGKPIDAKKQLKIDALTFKAFWEARTAIKRDYVLLGFAVISGTFIPFFLKYIASMFGRVVPW